MFDVLYMYSLYIDVPSHFYPGPLDQKTLKIDAFDGFQDEFLLPVDRYSDDINDTWIDLLLSQIRKFHQVQYFHRVIKAGFLDVLGLRSGQSWPTPAAKLSRRFSTRTTSWPSIASRFLALAVENQL